MNARTIYIGSSFFYDSVRIKSVPDVEKEEIMKAAKDNWEMMQGMFLTGERLCSFTLDQAFGRTESCDDARDLYYQMFMVSSSRTQTQTHFTLHCSAMVTVDSVGIGWIAGAKRAGSGEIRQYRLLGPFFILETNENYLYQICSRLKISSVMLQDITRKLKEIPCVSLGNARKYAAMMQYSLTEESIEPEEIAIYHEKAEQIREEISDEINYHGTWEAEQRFFRAVSVGAQIDKNSIVSTFAHGQVGASSDNPVRQLKNMLIVKTVLCSRAAMVGGVSPDGSYSLSDYYMQQIEKRNSIAALTDLSAEILQTFLYRSRQAKKEQGYSAQIRKIMEYVQDHIQEKILLRDIAAEVGYAEYYLSSKFKKEVGVSINSYITECKVQTARQMFDSGNFSISEVSDRLGFSTASYFGSVFKQITGLTPSEYLAGVAL